MANVEKFIRDGKVAVIYSPGYGAGWSTWNKKAQESFMFDKNLVIAVLNGNHKEIERIALQILPDAYISSTIEEVLKIAWLEQGEKFFIKEYDGSESIVLMKDFKTFEA